MAGQGWREGLEVTSCMYITVWALASACRPVGSQNWTDLCNDPADVDCVLASSAYTTNAWMSAYHLYVVFGSQEEALPGNAP